MKKTTTRDLHYIAARNIFILEPGTIFGSQVLKTGLAIRSQETQKYIYTLEFTTLTAQAPSTNKFFKDQFFWNFDPFFICFRLVFYL